MSEKVKSTSPWAPCNWTPAQVMVIAFVNGFLLKYNDVIGDREIRMTDEQYEFHSKLCIVIYSISMVILSVANLESCFMTVGFFFAAAASAKLDCAEHIIPAIFYTLLPILILTYFKNASWHSVDLSGDAWERGLVVATQLIVFGSFEEWVHEEMDDHPNPFVFWFFDTRPMNAFITYGMYYLSTKDMMVPKRFNKSVNWWLVFTNTLMFGTGYEVFRWATPVINEYSHNQ